MITSKQIVHFYNFSSEGIMMVCSSSLSITIPLDELSLIEYARDGGGS